MTCIFWYKGGPHPPNQSLNNSGYQIEIENLHSNEVKERGRVYDSGVQELEGSTGGVGSYLGDSGEHSSLGGVCVCVLGGGGL